MILPDCEPMPMWFKLMIVSAAFTLGVLFAFFSLVVTGKVGTRSQKGLVLSMELVMMTMLAIMIYYFLYP